MIARAKFDYEANFVLTYSMHIPSTVEFSNIIGQDHYPIEMFYNEKSAPNDSDKP